MKLIILFTLLLNSSFAAITPVSTGTPIEAAKINQLINKINELEQKVVPVGTIFSSMLTKTQFITENGDCWKALDGINSDLATTDELRQITSLTSVPNASGRFLRNVGGDAASLNSLQSDAFQGHWHGYKKSLTTTLTAAFTNQLPSSSQSYGGLALDVITDPVTDGVNGAPRTGAETRPVNLSVMMFVKFKKQCNF